jgi:tetratricopeptide (TPR) repeat protein
LNTTPLDDLKNCLLAARRRMALQTFLRALARGALGAGAGLVVAAAFFRWRLERWPLSESVIVGAVAALAFAAAVTWRGRRTLPEVAGIIDRLGRTHDRFLTALAFSSGPETEEMQALAVRECADFVRKGRFDRLARLRWPREAAWLLAPLITVAFLQWEARITFNTKDAETADAHAEVEDTAKKLEELARLTREANAQTPSDELKKMAERLKQGAEQLRAQASSPEDAAKAAMRELSALEQLAQEMQKSPVGASAEEMKKLAEALEKNAATKDAAAALKAGDLQKAAADLEQANQKLAEQKDARTDEDVRKELEKALQQLAEQEQLSEALQKLAQQMQRSEAPQGGHSSEAMKQLAQMLRQLQQGQGQGEPQQSDSGGMNSQTLQSLLSALQNMKYGEGEKGGSSKPQQAQASGIVAMQSFAGQMPGENPGRGDPNLPSGHPGSERDEGTTDSPFGKDRQQAGKETQAKQLAGRLGEGESLQQFIPSAGDTSKSNRRYKELYNAMAPAAEDAVLQESIPLGSRFFIKRYFEAIRPRE